MYIILNNCNEVTNVVHCCNSNNSKVTDKQRPKASLIHLYVAYFLEKILENCVYKFSMILLISHLL